VRRWLLLAVVAGLACAAAPAVAAAETCPPFEGVMTFPAIQGPEGAEDYCWEVKLGEGQELRQIDDQHAAVFYAEPEVQAFGIEAAPAHDAEGTAVPTTITVSGENLITLTVHHRAGNPAAGGTPFHYPVVAGLGWEGDFHTELIQGPPDESELRKPPPAPAPPAETPAPRCQVPSLDGRSLRAARRALRRANCDLGPVRGERARGARIVKQYRPPGKTFPADTAVGVKLAR
jgi:hypothetical protein